MRSILLVCLLCLPHLACAATYSDEQLISAARQLHAVQMRIDDWQLRQTEHMLDPSAPAVLPSEAESMLTDLDAVIAINPHLEQAYTRKLMLLGQIRPETDPAILETATALLTLIPASVDGHFAVLNHAIATGNRTAADSAAAALIALQPDLADLVRRQLAAGFARPTPATD